MKFRYIFLVIILFPFLTVIIIILGLGFISLSIIEALIKPFCKHKEPEKPKGIIPTLLKLIPNENVSTGSPKRDHSERRSAS